MGDKKLVDLMDFHYDSNNAPSWRIRPEDIVESDAYKRQARAAAKLSKSTEEV